MNSKELLVHRDSANSARVLSERAIAFPTAGAERIVLVLTSFRCAHHVLTRLLHERRDTERARRIQEVRAPFREETGHKIRRGPSDPCGLSHKCTVQCAADDSVN